MQAQYMLTRFSHWQLLSKPIVLLFQCYVITQVTSQACAMTVDTAVINTCVCRVFVNLVTNSGASFSMSVGNSQWSKLRVFTAVS